MPKKAKTIRCLHQDLFVADLLPELTVLCHWTITNYHYCDGGRGKGEDQDLHIILGYSINFDRDCRLAIAVHNKDRTEILDIYKNESNK